jgi:hypothetical protein
VAGDLRVFSVVATLCCTCVFVPFGIMMPIILTRQEDLILRS